MNKDQGDFTAVGTPVLVLPVSFLQSMICTKKAFQIIQQG